MLGEGTGMFGEGKSPLSLIRLRALEQALWLEFQQIPDAVKCLLFRFWPFVIRLFMLPIYLFI